MQDPQGTSDEGLIVEHITAVYTRDATAEKMCRVPESLRHGVGLCRGLSMSRVARALSRLGSPCRRRAALVSVDDC